MRGPDRPANHARFIFLDARSHSFYPDWERAANDTVAILRTEAGRDPFDRGLTDLVGELSTRSEEFRTLWAAHNVRQHYTGLKHFHHPVVGELHLMFEALDVSADAGLSLLVYTAEPGSASEDALRLLASWAATNRQVKEAEAATAGGQGLTPGAGRTSHARAEMPSACPPGWPPSGVKLFSQAMASSREVKNSWGYRVCRLIAAAMTRSTVLDPSTAIARTPVVCANSYLAAALISTSVISESIGIGVRPLISSTARMASLASWTSTKEPGRQTDIMMPALTLSTFFPSALQSVLPSS